MVLKILFIYFCIFINLSLGALPTTTNWNSISPLILQSFANGLPTPPTSYLSADWSSYPQNPFTIFTLNKNAMTNSTCGQPLAQSAKFPQNAIEFGGVQMDGTNPSCRVMIDGDMIQLMNKRKPDNSVPISANPSWVQFRFPLPNKSDYGTPQKITITLDSRLGQYGVTAFGGNPCAPNNCTILTEGPWDPKSKAGYYVLLGTPSSQSSSSGYTILGPYLSDPYLQIPVPADYKNVKELDIVIFAFSTYPYNTGCPSTGNCYIYLHKILRITSVSLEMGIDFEYNRLPDQGHPRLYGNHSGFWTTKIKPFWDLPCDNLAPGGLSVHNMRDTWEFNLFGGSICKNSRKSFSSNPTVSNYVSGNLQANTDVRYKEGRNAMYLIRFLQSCLALGRTDCVYTKTDLDSFIPKVIQGELRFWSLWGDWNGGYSDGNGLFGFDLGTPGPLGFWSTFVDTFWNDLDLTNKTLIITKMDSVGSSFRRVYQTKGWPLWNGNNWTPVLSNGAVYYSIVRWYENATLAQGVMTDMLSVLYRTRPMYLNDGVYVEGLAHYTTMSSDSFINIDYLINSALGIHTFAIDWNNFNILHMWVLDGLLTDSFTMDFGDSHFTQFGSLTPIYSIYIPEIIGYGTATVDPCAVLRFWTNHYFSSGLDQSFDVHSVMARNWTHVVSGCKDYKDSTSFYPLGGNGMFRRKVKDSPNVAITSRSKHADFTNLVLEAKSNSYPHTESDFGGIIWAGYGARFLYDMSYGTIAKEDKTLQIDNNPAGANTLVVENAFQLPNGSYSTIINKSQFSPVTGTIESLEITQDQVTFKYFKLDGSNVYGRNRADGWLNRFYRYGISIPGGHYIILDTITKHSRFQTQSLSISEYFYSGLDNEDPTSCGLYTITNTMRVINNNLMEITPQCRNIGETTKPPIARIAGAGLLGNAQFIYDGNITYEGVLYKRRVRTRFNGVVDSLPDARAFLLVAADNATALPSTLSIKVLACADLSNTKCFEAQVADQSYRIELVSDQDGYLLSCIRPKIGGIYSNSACQSTTSSTTSSSTNSPVSTTGGIFVTTASATTGGGSTTTDPITGTHDTTGSLNTGTVISAHQILILQHLLIVLWIVAYSL